jgi:hypothetical protein
LTGRAAAVPGTSLHTWRYLDNGHVRLGVNLDAGGAIGWFSASTSPTNLLNTFDHGRYVQQSFYGDPDGSDWNGKPWRYNPVQGGSWRNVPATVEEQDWRDGALYVKTRPRQWASGEEVPDMRFEQWLRLEGGLARLHFRMTYTGTTAHRARHQELPAVFVNPRFDTLVYCAQGADPWTGADLTRRQPGFPNEPARFSEPWAAWEAADGQALGVCFPHTLEATVYRVTGTGKGDCSYLAPVRTFALVPGSVFAHETILATGTVEQLRAVFRRVQADRQAGATGTP